METEIILILISLFVPSCVVCIISWIGVVKYINYREHKFRQDILDLLKMFEENK